MPNDPTATITFKWQNNQPQWSVDHDPLRVPNVPNVQTVIWQLSTASASGAAFANPGGITFQNPSSWPGTQPAPAGRNYRATETNNNPGPDPVTFKYNVAVTYTPPGGSAQTFHWDPDVSNDPPSGGPIPIELPDQAKGDPPRGPASGGGNG